MVNQADCFKRLEQLVLEENKEVSYEALSSDMKIHVNEAKQYLYEFFIRQLTVEKTTLYPTYFLAGIVKDDGEETVKIVITTQENLEKEKDKLAEVISCHIYSVSKTTPDKRALMETVRYYSKKVGDQQKYSAIRHSIIEIQSPVIYKVNTSKNDSKSTVVKNEGGVPGIIRTLSHPQVVYVPVSLANLKTLQTGPGGIVRTLSPQQITVTSQARTENQQMSADRIKKKCQNFLSTLIRFAREEDIKTASNVTKLIQNLIDGTIEPEECSTQLPKELQSNHQPYLKHFFKKSLPHIRQALITGEMTIEGLRPPPLPAYMQNTVVTPQGGIIRTPGIIRTLSHPQVVYVPMSLANVKTLQTGPAGIVRTLSPQQITVTSQALTKNQQPPRTVVSTVLQQTTSSVTRSTSSVAAASSGDMSPDRIKNKCQNFLSTLIRFVGEEDTKTASNVTKLIQNLIDGTIEPEEFTTQLQKELRSKHQPYLINFLKKSLPYVQQALMTGEMTIEGILPPPLPESMQNTVITLQSKSQKSNPLASLWQKNEEKSHSETETNKLEVKGKGKSPQETKEVQKNNIFSMFSKQAEKTAAIDSVAKKTSASFSPKKELASPQLEKVQENIKATKKRKASQISKETKTSKQKNDSGPGEDIQTKIKHRWIRAFQESDSESKCEGEIDELQRCLGVSEFPLAMNLSTKAAIPSRDEELIPPTPHVKRSKEERDEDIQRCLGVSEFPLALNLSTKAVIPSRDEELIPPTPHVKRSKVTKQDKS